MQTVQQMAQALMYGVDWLQYVVHVAAVIIGVFLLVNALGLFKAHRENPKHVPLDKPIVYLLLAGVLFVVPFLQDFLYPASDFDSQATRSAASNQISGGLQSNRGFAVAEIDQAEGYQDIDRPLMLETDLEER